MTKKGQRLTAYLLLVLSIVVLGVPVVPHHHHHDGLICMKDDIGTRCCPPAADTPAGDNEHCCCHTGCITTHFFQQRPDTDLSRLQPATLILPDFLPAAAPLPTDGYNLGSTRQASSIIYIEPLHGTYRVRAKGLRAPPAILV